MILFFSQISFLIAKFDMNVVSFQNNKADDETPIYLFSHADIRYSKIV